MVLYLALPCKTRDIRKKLLEKSKMFGCFTQRDIDNGVHEDLLGERRLVVLDIDEFRTSKNINSPELDVDHEVVLAKQVRGIHAVVVENGMCLCSINSSILRTIYCMEPRHQCLS